jgi:two-component system, NtrC family, nitrogen regulation response regulator GlnG
VRALAAFNWPGNVRQLENMANWLTVMAPSQLVSAKDLPVEVQQYLPQMMLDHRQVTTATPAVFAPATALMHPAVDERIPVQIQPLSNSTQGAPVSNGHMQSAPPTASYDAQAFRSERSDVNMGVSIPSGWEEILAKEVNDLLAAQPIADRDSGESELMNGLARRFESTVIKQALKQTRGRRIDAALRLGIGRNTITRKIQELKLED